MSIKINQEIIEQLILMNGEFYNLHKATEELQELSLILTQKLLKPEQVNVQQIIDEIGDVLLRMEIVKSFFSEEQIQARISKKEADFAKWIKEGTYKQI